MAGRKEALFIFGITGIRSERPMQPSEQFLKDEQYAQAAGIGFVDAGEGTATVKMLFADRHKNSHGTVHGGAIFTLADTAFALASNSRNVPASAINAHISFVRSASSGMLYARAEEFSVSRKIATYTVTVTGEEGEKIAIFQGMVYRKTPGK